MKRKTKLFVVGMGIAPGLGTTMMLTISYMNPFQKKTIVLTTKPALKATPGIESLVDLWRGQEEEKFLVITILNLILSKYVLDYSEDYRENLWEEL